MTDVGTRYLMQLLKHLGIFLKHFKRGMKKFPADIFFSRVTIETLEHNVNMFRVNNESNDVILVSIVNFKHSHTLF